MSAIFSPFPEAFLFPREESFNVPPHHKEQRIRELAYYKWQDAGSPFCSGLEFWLQAEAEYEAAERLVIGNVIGL